VELTVKELFDLRESMVLTLDKDTREPVEISLDDSFGVRHYRNHSN